MRLLLVLALSAVLAQPALAGSSKSRSGGRAPSSLSSLSPQSGARPKTSTGRCCKLPSGGATAAMLGSYSSPDLEKSAELREPRLQFERESRAIPRTGTLSPQFRHADVSVRIR